MPSGTPYWRFKSKVRCMKVLCHYTKELAARAILESSELKFGLLAQSNDPIEIKQLSFWAKGLEDETIKDINRCINSYRDNILRLLCFSMGTLEANLLGNNDGVIFIDELGSHPPFYLPRTWAQYGENHKEVCFVFSKQKLTAKFRKLAASKYEFRLEDLGLMRKNGV